MDRKRNANWKVWQGKRREGKEARAEQANAELYAANLPQTVRDYVEAFGVSVAEYAERFGMPLAAEVA